MGDSVPQRGRSAPTAAEAEFVRAYCHSGGDLAKAAERSALSADEARAAMRAPWWQTECRAYWREHAPTLAQATIAIRDVLSDEDTPPSVRVQAAKAAMEHHIAERAVGALEDLVGLARSGTADRLIAEMTRRNLLRLPPEQHRIALAHAERLLEASNVTTVAVDVDRVLDVDYAAAEVPVDVEEA